MPVVLTPSRVFVSLIEIPALRISAIAWDRETTESVPGQVNEYASGRQVSVVLGEKRTSHDITLYDLPADDYEMLKWMLGKPVVFRDRHGRKSPGVIFAINVVDFKDSAYDISFTLNSVTMDEEV